MKLRLEYIERQVGAIEMYCSKIILRISWLQNVEARQILRLLKTLVHVLMKTQLPYIYFIYFIYQIKSNNGLLQQKQKIILILLNEKQG